ncbi:hypothetical protein Tco_0840606 [Tanacetum coccineum]|uniref:Uncharacterized protein n=4 Tax=Tanacetum coccineum TaxID=301880 RepID=A0ABQ5AYZ4_9ASTR
MDVRVPSCMAQLIRSCQAKKMVFFKVQDKYVQNPKKFDFSQPDHDVCSMYLKGKPKPGLWSVIFLQREYISWQCKKQTIVATSTTEAEYVAAANCCGQVLWIQNQMLDYGFSQMSAKDKNGLGYGTQLDEMRSFLTPSADTSFAGKTNKIEKSNLKINRDKFIIEDWNSDDEDDVSEKERIGFKKIKACFVCKSTDHLIKDCDFYDKKSPEPKLKTGVNTGQRVVKPVWDNAKRVNQQNFSNKLKYPQARRSVVPSGVLTKIGLVNPVRPNGKRAVHTISIARPISTARSVSTARQFALKIAQSGSAIRTIYPRMDNVRPRSSYSPIKRPYYTKLTFRPKKLKQDVETSRVKNMTIAGTKAVVNIGKGKMDNDLKKSRWVWRPKGNYMDHESKDKGSFILKKFEYVDPKGISNGCSSHMTGNKAYLSDYRDYNGGFVAFGSDPKGDELKFNLFSVSQMCDKKNSVLFTDTECLILSTSFKLLDENQVVLRAPRQNRVYSLDLKNIVPYGGDQPPETSSSHATTQNSRDSLEGTNGNEGDQVHTPHDSSLSGFFALESIKDAQAAKLSALKSRIKKLEKKCKPSISHHRAWLKSVSMKKRFGKKESVSKQWRKKSKPESNLDDSTVFDDQDADHGMEYMETEEAVDERRQSGGTRDVKLNDDTKVVEDKGSGDKGGNAEELVSTARPDIDAARQEDSVVEPRTPPTTTSIFDDEDITMAQTFIKMKEEKAKEKGVSIKDVDDSSRPARSILTLKPLPTIDPKDKGKGVLKESPVKKVKRSDLDAAQIAKDAEIARLVHEKELAEMEREREERQRQDQASVDYIASLYDEVQAKMDASEELAARLQMEEREMYTIEERSKLLAEFFERRKKLLAEERAAAVRNKPPTRTQLRSLMMTYLKHTGKYRHNQLNKKTFEEIQALYIKEQERDADFVPIGSERDEKMIDKMNKKAAGMDEEEVPEEPESTKVEVKQEGREENIRKRSGRRLKMKATKKSKRQKTDSDLEEEEQLRASLKIVPDEEEEIDYEVLGTRYPIVNWESAFYHTDRYGVPHDYYRVFRANGSSRYIKTFTEMVSRFDRLDFIELHSLVMQRFSTTTPEGIDLVLWGDLRIMFEETADDDIWKNQEKWIIKSWTFYENCGVHILALEDGTEIHMLAERRYPLIRETLERMMELRLTAESEGEAVFDLLRFIQKQIDEFGGQDGSEKDL